MPKFIVIESQMVSRRVEFRYKVEAESKAAAIDAVRLGPTDNAKVSEPERTFEADEEFGSSGFAACLADAPEAEYEDAERRAWEAMEHAESLGLTGFDDEDE